MLKHLKRAALAVKREVKGFVKDLKDENTTDETQDTPKEENFNNDARLLYLGDDEVFLQSRDEFEEFNKDVELDYEEIADLLSNDEISVLYEYVVAQHGEMSRQLFWRRFMFHRARNVKQEATVSENVASSDSEPVAELAAVAVAVACESEAE
ncbi:hypothetical protein PCE1_002872 [Barthelona sp. PCE]